LGLNAGTDGYTGRSRNNGVAWIRRHEPALLPILERLFGRDPQGPGPANPREETRAENELWETFRAFWDEVEGVYRPQPHALATAPPMAPPAQDTATTAGPGRRSGSAEDVGPLPAPPGEGSSPARRRSSGVPQVLSAVFGARVAEDPQYEVMVRGFEVLEAGGPRSGIGHA
ncbi:hypothetical protein AB4212_70735, partial [Streptomyces sp. 2MCAF27]